MKRIASGLNFVVLSQLLPMLAFAEEGAATSSGSSNGGIIAIAAGFCMAIAAFAGAFGQGKAAAAALEGIARNPQAQKNVFTPMLLGMALIEAIVILAFTIAILLWTKI